MCTLSETYKYPIPGKIRFPFGFPFSVPVLTIVPTHSPDTYKFAIERVCVPGERQFQRRKH